jgi:ribosome biogenesis GTPase
MVLTKSDIASDVDAAIHDVESVAVGVPVHAVSCVTENGLAPLHEYLREGRTVALLGMSGAGKSTLVNTLAGQDLLRVLAVSDTDARGRHTTTHRQLVRLPGGGMLVDTPGMRELQLWDAAGGISDTFGDIEDLAEACRFRDCTHSREPGCAVLAAADAGTLDAERLESYHKLQREQAYLDRRDDPVAQQARTREVKEIMKSMRQHPKYR